MPPAFITVGRSPVAGMAHLRVAGLLIAIVPLYYTGHTPFGRQVHAVGTRSGSPSWPGSAPAGSRTLAFVLAGTMVAIGAIFQSGSAAAADPAFGPADGERRIDDHHGKHRDCAMGHADQL